MVCLSLKRSHGFLGAVDVEFHWVVSLAHLDEVEPVNVIWIVVQKPVHELHAEHPVVVIATCEKPVD